jgi:hypothetical protein
VNCIGFGCGRCDNKGRRVHFTLGAKGEIIEGRQGNRMRETERLRDRYAKHRRAEKGPITDRG